MTAELHSCFEWLVAGPVSTKMDDCLQSQPARSTQPSTLRGMAK